MEPDRGWDVDLGDLNVTFQSSLMVRGKRVHPHGFLVRLFIHFPYDTYSRLRRVRPEIIVSGELGFRSLLCFFYRVLNRNSRLVIWGTLSEYSEINRGVLRKFVRRWILGAADAVLVNGESGARYIKRFNVPDESIFRIGQAVDVSLFNLEPTRAGPSATRLLYVGWLRAGKGLSQFIAILSRYAEDYPKREIDLWIVGDGEEKENIEDINKPANLTISMFGSVEYNKLKAYYQECGIFVFPTLSDEWGLVVNEAMAAGQVVLGSRYSQAVEELIEDGKTGWVFQPDDFEDTYRAIDRMMNCSPEELDVMRLAAQRAISKMNMEKMSNTIIEAFEYVKKIQ